MRIDGIYTESFVYPDTTQTRRQALFLGSSRLGVVHDLFDQTVEGAAVLRLALLAQRHGGLATPAPSAASSRLRKCDLVTLPAARSPGTDIFVTQEYRSPKRSASFGGNSLAMIYSAHKAQPQTPATPPPPLHY